MTDDQWAKAIIMHLTGQPEDPSPMLLKMIASIRSDMTDEQIKHMVDRFLGWRLPEPWSPDGGVSYKRPNYAHAPAAHDWPVGTNLFDAAQTEAMVRYMAEGMPALTEGIPT